MRLPRSPFTRAFLSCTGGAFAGDVLALTAGEPAEPFRIAGVAAGFAVAVVTYRPAREDILRRVTRRPRRTMTPEDYERLAEDLSRKASTDAT